MPLAVAAPELLEFDRHALLAGDIWRLWIGHLVHYSWQQSLVDGAVALVAGLIAARAYGLRRLLAAHGAGGDGAVAGGQDRRRGAAPRARLVGHAGRCPHLVAGAPAGGLRRRGRRMAI